MGWFGFAHYFIYTHVHKNMKSILKELLLKILFEYCFVNIKHIQTEWKKKRITVDMVTLSVKQSTLISAPVRSCQEVIHHGKAFRTEEFEMVLLSMERIM